ncbi:MAG: TonB-dependent receptor [Calditrichia bacterium]
MKKLIFFMFVLIILSNIPVFGQETLQDMSLEELLNMDIRISSSKATTIFNSPSTVSVIDKDMIKQYNFLTISEAIRIVAGIDILRTYLKRNLPTSRGILQDHYANKVLFLIDNVPTWHAVTGETNIDRIDINDVERIEILKGPASVLYGSNAYSAAINVVLKKSVNDALNTHMGMSNGFGAYAGGNYIKQGDNLKLWFSGNVANDVDQHFNFIDESGQTGRVDEYLKNTNFTFKGSYKEHSLLLNGFTLNESYLGVAPKFTSGTGKDHFTYGYITHYQFNKKLKDNVNFKAGGAFDWHQRNLSRSLEDTIRANIEGYRYNIFLKSEADLNPSINIESGVNYEYRFSKEYMNYSTLTDKVLSEGNHNNMKNRSVSEFSGYAQIGVNKQKWNVLLGTRYTNNELFGDNISSRGTLVFTINDDNSVKLIVGQSFRAPSLFELYFQTGSATVFGNKNLEPETSTSMELAYLTHFNKFFIQILGYYAEYQNKIFRGKGDVVFPDTTYINKSVYLNGESFTATGVEFELKYTNPSVANAFLNVSYINGDDGDKLEGSEHYNFKYIPELEVSAGFAKNFKKVILSALLNYQGSRESFDNSELEAQSFVDVNLTIPMAWNNKFVEHHFSVKNVTDEMGLVPEYVRRRTITDVPLGFGRKFVYTLKIFL